MALEAVEVNDPIKKGVDAGKVWVFLPELQLVVYSEHYYLLLQENRSRESDINEA